ncbi:DUF998 domain-containing protein [Actinoplanes sp. RD1]|uniref:DUF998 domain-containing protein n=1 Tax=Actinoplanes sp. RD1 TaxID=3064538 RepID=UPI0027408AAF|nr:DUF998 domain-containing protein [Actinoplanes sp. RD1]
MTPSQACENDTAARVTRSLLGYGALAGPCYVITSVAQGLLRDGFDFRRHEWSVLATGSYGWIQTANLALTGLMVVAFAAGLSRAAAGAWAPRLIAVLGLGMIGAAAFRADPHDGFPAGTPDGPGEVSWHGLLHLATSGIGFLCAVTACFVLARRYARAGRRTFARASVAVGVLFLLTFAGIASGGGSAGPVLAFCAGVVALFGWMAVVAVDRYRTV